MTGSVLAAMLVVSGCGAKEPPMQVVYRFDDHRYLELKGWNCEGELWYTDTQRGIHSQLYFQFSDIHQKICAPFERYLVIPNWDPGLSEYLKITENLDHGDIFSRRKRTEW